MRYYIDVMDHDDGDKSFHVCYGGQTVAVVKEGMFDDRASARAAAEMVRTALTEYVDRRNGKLSANAITSYAQIEAIHEAMREAESVFNDINVNYEDDSDAAKHAFAKIRAALAGEKAIDDGSP